MGVVKQETSPKSKSQDLQQTSSQQTEPLSEQSYLSHQSNPIGQTISRISNTPSPKAHAAILNGAPTHSRHVLLQLQRQYGNRYVQQVVQQARQTERSKIQAKLTLGAVGDKYEQEADRVAKEVVSNISSASQQPVQRRSPEEEEQAQMKPDIQRMATSDATTVDPSIEDGIQQARGGGQPLADSIREPMEQAFGTDFNRVKVHTDSQADQLNQSIQAKAFTMGRDVFFRKGEYNPGSRGGQELIAHELTHVVQQGGGSVMRSPDKDRVQPTTETIGAFFKWLKGGKEPDLSNLSIDQTKLESNKEVYLKEFSTRLRVLKPDINDEVIQELYEELINIFVKKDVSLAKKFLASLSSRAGLKPLEQESERLYWSGKQSRQKAYETSEPISGATALEKTEIGGLLDKFPLFEAIPWDLSTLLWAEVSRCFSVGARGTMNVFIDGGFAKGNVFWNDELPALRFMQRYGLVDNIVIHIWHTKDKRWIKEFDIQSENLQIVFNKALRISAPTPEKPDNTRSYRYDNPIKVSVLTKVFMRYLQSMKREKPLIFYNFRLKTGVFADAVKKDYGMEVSLFNYGSDAKKIVKIEASKAELEGVIKSAELFLMENYSEYESIVEDLNFSKDGIKAGDSFIARKEV
ncbi:MAG: DUF4157 domain-containing protein [Cyanomargarita calcarea GSE-NOS-MK-12-04C]|jgi:hypothetical protein|uniref:DUF4157 domain-containing protein n=1 Tax=Cyanomargarita calcarea GSE-NOS-MK-12-04C TaxID=2839659 RepID=A0A951QLN9_9CYAN|nr:DUF4157 domain-containing protein [Cyanomargarita calcarea GSE-NOS-MK-12-04C]